jgi:predicted Fe-Mo cluster-binding NifX family protein
MIFAGDHKVAVATSDGKEIASHIGSACFFNIYTIREGQVVARESRENHRHWPGHAESSQAGCWQLIEEMLPDVRVVISHGMGENAYVGLLRRDVLPITADEKDAEEAVSKYLDDRLSDNPRLIHPVKG